MKNENKLRDSYLIQYNDIYGENLYLSPIDLISDKVDILEGGRNITAFYHLTMDCKFCFNPNSQKNFFICDKNSKILFLQDEDFKDNQKSYNSLLSEEKWKLFDKILSAIELSPQNICISSIMKYFSFGKTKIEKNDIYFCEYHTLKMIEEFNPSLVVVLGQKVGERILNYINTDKEVLDNNIYNLNGIDLMVTYHPKEVLLDSNLKKMVWEDFKKIRDNYLT